MRRGRAAALVALVLVAGVGGVLVAGAGPADAIETASFGLGPSGDGRRTALHEQVRPGKHVDDGVRLWNKTGEPVTVSLTVQGASIAPDGTVSLGGNGGAAKWVHLGRSSVTLAAHASTVVPVKVSAPRTLPAGTTTAAVVAEPVLPGAKDAAVVQRVALMVYVGAPAGAPLTARLGRVVWTAAGLLALVLLFALRPVGGRAALARLSGRGRPRMRPATPARGGPRP
ncbi:MAG TPA: hypothetical protein VGO92_13755 [Acidimicrobiales bacterium]|nr:hypothetical protein [Acidimicrobiales bacterium]